MKNIESFISAILGGICIGIGGTAYLACESSFIGAILFGIGLFVICLFGINLYTGKIGYVFQHDKTYAINIPIILIGNLVGAWIMGLLVRAGGLTNIIANATIHAQNTLNDGLLHLFILAILCNVMIYIAVEGYRRANSDTAKIAILFLGVIVFIICGFKHSIAEMYYFSVEGLSLGVIIPMLVMIAGNAVGGIVAHNAYLLVKNENNFTKVSSINDIINQEEEIPWEEHIMK